MTTSLSGVFLLAVSFLIASFCARRSQSGVFSEAWISAGMVDLLTPSIEAMGTMVSDTGCTGPRELYPLDFSTFWQKR